MTLNELKAALKGLPDLKFILPNGQFIPAHFHITEVGLNTRHFIDCGGTERIEKKVNLQLWVEDADKEHRDDDAVQVGVGEEDRRHRRIGQVTAAQRQDEDDHHDQNLADRLRELRFLFAVH